MPDQSLEKGGNKNKVYHVCNFGTQKVVFHILFYYIYTFFCSILARFFLCIFSFYLSIDKLQKK